MAMDQAMRLPGAAGTASGEEAPPSLKAAARSYWWTFWLFLAAFGVGTSWDRAWHATHPFEDFYSPPHLFIYGCFAAAGVCLARLALSPERRAWFGESVRLPIVGEVPAALVFAACGYAVVACAGLLDDYWHTRFGLDETRWSTPHAMLGWGILLSSLGLVSARLALRRHLPLSQPTLIFLTLLVLSIASSVPLGALGNYGTKDLAAHVAALPVLAHEAPAQHTFRIIEQWNLTRTNAAFVPVAALACGFALSLAHRLTRGGWLFVLVVALVTLLSVSSAHRTAAYFGVAHDARNWLPLPILPAALVYMAARKLPRLGGAAEWPAWLIAGAAFSLFAASWWGGHGLLTLAGVAAMPLGAAAGAWAYSAIESPRATSIRVMALVAFATPFAVGMLDLYLRHHTA